MIASFCLGHPRVSDFGRVSIHLLNLPVRVWECVCVCVCTMAAFNCCSLKCAIMACTDHRAVIVSHDLNIEHIEHIVHIHHISHKAHKDPSTNNSLVSACSACVACWKAWIWKISTLFMTLFGHKASTIFVVSFSDLQSSTCGGQVGEFGAQEYILTYLW